MPCAHAVLRRALLGEVDIEQTQRLEQPPVALDVTQAVLHGRSAVCTVMGVASGLGGTVGAWRRAPPLLPLAWLSRPLPLRLPQSLLAPHAHHLILGERGVLEVRARHGRRGAEGR